MIEQGDLVLHVGEIDTTWTPDNLIYRSSVWKDKEPISLGFKKFFNWGENIQLSPVPTDISSCELIEKIDGSCLIVSRLPDGGIMIRTRGTFDARGMKNGHEIDILMKKYPQAFDPTFGVSVIYEWTSPTNKIILNYGDEPDIYLTGAVIHADYSYMSQNDLDVLAKLYNVKRPRRYNFSSMTEMLNAVRELKGQEGLCVYSSNGQVIHKVKSAWYLALHKMKSELSSMDHIIDLWLSLGKPQYTDFYNHLVTTFDYELAEQVKGDLSKVCDAAKTVNHIIIGMQVFVSKMQQLETRKEQALKIIASYGKTSRSGFVFALLDNKPLGDDAYKKLIWQTLEAK